MFIEIFKKNFSSGWLWRSVVVIVSLSCWINCLKRISDLFMADFNNTTNNLYKDAGDNYLCMDSN